MDYRITNVSLKGNVTFRSGDLLEKIELDVPGWIGETILGEKPIYYSEETPARSANLLRNYYQQEGFLYVDVAPPRVEIDDVKQTVTLEFSLEERRPVLVGSIEFRTIGLTGSALAAGDSILGAVRPKLALKKGERFRDALATTDINSISSGFMNAGFPYVKAAYVLEVDTSAATVNILWNITPGPAATFGDVAFHGNIESGDDVMRVRLAFEPGDVYDHSKLTDTQKDLYTLGIYQVVSCKSVIQSQQPANIPVQIVVKEAPEWTTKFGVGYGKEEKFRAFTSLQWLRFLGGARSLDIFLKHSALEPVHASVTFTQPDLLIRLTKFIVNPYLVQEVEPAYSATRIGSNVSLKKNFIKNLDGQVTFNYEHVKQDGVSSTAPENDPTGNYTKMSLSGGLLNDSSLPLFDPSTGLFTFGGLTYTSFLQSSLSTYYKAELELRNYRPITDAIVLAGRVKTSLILPTATSGVVPIEERLFSGGANSVRGYAYSSLGPVGADGKPVGGNTLLEASLEARFPIAGIISGGIFSDAGNVWEQARSYRLSELLYSVGTGVRVGTPVGPLRFDVAWPIFSGSGPTEYYFTIGHAF